MFQNFRLKREKTIFQVGAGEKREGNQNFSKILGGTKVLNTGKVVRDKKYVQHT